MILIEENFNGIVTEAATGDAKKKYLAGCFGEAGVKNRNQRIYDLKEMQAEVTRINEEMKLGRFIGGELDHPQTLEIRLENVSHKITQLEMQGNKMFGKAEIITAHPKGQMLLALAEANMVGVSTRGSGQLNEATGEVKNFKLVTVDAVGTPSCRSAYPETLEESLQLSKRYGTITDLSEAAVHDERARMFLRTELIKHIQNSQ